MKILAVRDYHSVDGETATVKIIEYDEEEAMALHKLAKGYDSDSEGEEFVLDIGLEVEYNETVERVITEMASTDLRLVSCGNGNYAILPALMKMGFMPALKHLKEIKGSECRNKKKRKIEYHFGREYKNKRKGMPHAPVNLLLELRRQVPLYKSESGIGLRSPMHNIKKWHRTNIFYGIPRYKTGEMPECYRWHVIVEERLMNSLLAAEAELDFRPPEKGGLEYEKTILRGVMGENAARPRRNST
jgi:hypothetical protein